MSLVSAAMRGAVAVYAGVVYVLVELAGIQAGGSAPAIAGRLPWVAGAAAILLGVGMMVARRAGEIEDSSASPEQRVGRYFTLRLIAQAIQEGAGLLVITSSLIVGDGMWAVAAGFATFAVMSLTRPHADDLDRLLRG